MSNLIIKNTPNKGRGLFTTPQIEPNQVILMFSGSKLLRDEIDDFAGNKASDLLQIGTKLYLDLSKTNGFFINHSCKPNAYIKIAINTAFLVSILPIAAGEELTYDYSLTSTEGKDTFLLSCACSIFGCRKEISGFDLMTDEQKARYIKLGVVPKYVIDSK